MKKIPNNWRKHEKISKLRFESYPFFKMVAFKDWIIKYLVKFFYFFWGVGGGNYVCDYRTHIEIVGPLEITFTIAMHNSITRAYKIMVNSTQSRWPTSLTLHHCNISAWIEAQRYLYQKMNKPVHSNIHFHV